MRELSNNISCPSCGSEDVTEVCNTCQKNKPTKEIIYNHFQSNKLNVLASVVYCDECYELKLQQIHPSRITKEERYLKVDCRDLYPGTKGYETELQP